jgi:hypothetical protein
MISEIGTVTLPFPTDEWDALPEPKVCPHCGKCPHCGQGANPAFPWDSPLVPYEYHPLHPWEMPVTCITDNT